MKVLYISGMYPTPTYPQKGIFCHEQVKALKKIGVEVDVIVPMTIYDKEYTTKIWEYEGVAIRYIRYFKLPGVRRFENIGKHLYHALVRAKIDFTQYDVLHADAPLPTGDAMRLISKKYGIPFIVHGHGLDVFMAVDYQDASNCEKIVKKCIEVYSVADAIAGVSQKVLDNIIKRVDVSDKCFTVYNGVDIDKFSQNIYKNNEKLEIISVGNLIDLKGHDITLRAISKLVQEGKKNLHFTLYGRGSKELELRELIKKLNISEYVTFRGYVSYEEVATGLRNSDIFVLPSWYEAIGCVYLEAMASGIVSVGCYKNGIDEIINHSENGFLVRPHNIEDVAEVLRFAYDKKDKEEFQKVAENGRATVVKYFTWKCSAENLLKVYESVKEERE